MTNEERRERVREMILEEVKGGTLPRWFYISIVTGGKFYGGVLLSARGPTEAWTLAHALSFIPKDSWTTTMDVPEDKVAEIPEGYAWRLLTEEECRKGW